MRVRPLRFGLFAAWLLGACDVPNAMLLDDGSLNPVDSAHQDAGGDASGPPPMISAAPASDTNFGDALVGSSSSSVTYTVTNDGGSATGALATSFTDATLGFTTVNDTCNGQTLAPQRSCTVAIKFTPVAPGSVSTAFHVSASPGGDISRNVAGNGLMPGSINIVEASFDYSSLAVDAAAVTHVFDVTNMGQVAIGMPAPTISGATDSYFVSASTCTTTMLAPAVHCTITVKFDPSTVGDKAGAVTVTSTGGGQDVATLSGLAVAHVLVDKTGSTGTGSIKSSQTGIDCGTTCPNQGADFSSSPITLNATADVGSTFVAWTGDCTGAGSCTLDLIGAKHVTATFTAITPALNVTKTGSGTGSVASDVAGITCGASCSHNYPFNTNVTLTATASSGSTFTGWGGACSGTGTCVVTMSAQRDVIATFDSVTPTLNVTLAGTGAGTVTSPSGINCGTTCTQSYSFNTMVTLTATANAGSSFTGWSGTGAGTCTTATTCVLTMSQARDITATFDKVTPTLTVVRGGGGMGTVVASAGLINCGATCSDTYAFNQPVTLTATATAGSTFTGWTGATGCTTSATCLVTMDGPHTVTATFTPITPQLTIAITGGGTGTVIPNPAGTACGAGCATYPFNQVVVLTASPTGASTFTGWSGPDAGTCAAMPTCSVTMSQARSVTATFDLPTPVLTVSTTGTGAGSVVSNPPGISCPGTCSKTYTINTSVTLTATPNAGSTFTGWTGNPSCTGTGTCTVPMDHAYTIGATFTAITPALTVTVNGTGTGTVGSSPAGIASCTASSGTCAASFPFNQPVTLTAAATGNSTFVGWSGTGAGTCAGTATATCVVTMDQARAVTATFNAGQQTLTITEVGPGTGTVVTTGITCPGTCTNSYTFGTTLTLTATATNGSMFTGWSGTGAGTCAGTTAPCTITMDQVRAITATFSAGPQTLTVSTSGTGLGVVTSSPLGINCGNGNTACSMSQPYNTMVTLTPTGAGTDTFANWTGACTGSGPCTVTLTAATAVGAVFTAGPRVITVVATGSGTGSVSSSPAGITGCTSSGGTCVGSFPFNQSVVLTETPTGGSTFTGWSGADSGACNGTATTTCTVSANQARTITATFAPGQQTLTVSLPGSGTGTISSNPGGLSCSGAPCTGSFTFGQTVVLTAMATNGSTFSGWSGGICTGTGTCSVTMNGPQTVTATFVAGPQTLTVTKSGTGAAAGVVNSGDTAINCGTACSNTYPFNTMVSLTATPGTGDSFTGWSGACTGTGACTVTMNQAQSVTATFAAGNRTLTVTTTPTAGGGSISSSPSGILNCGTASGTCSASYANGTSVTLTETPAPGYTFSGWGGGTCSGTATTCSVTMDMARTVTAMFTINSYTLTAAMPSNGVIKSSDGFINCGTAGCSHVYTYNSIVTLTATPNANFAFTAWTGACAGQGNPCTLTITAAQSVGATFTAASTNVLTVVPDGPGKVTGSGISCGTGGTTCTSNLPTGTVVTLTATPDANQGFLGWGGACTGTSMSCTFTLSANLTVQAHFGIRVDVSVVAQYGGGITLTSNIAALSCTANVGVGGCARTAFVPPNTTVNVSYTEDGEASGCTWSGSTPAWMLNGQFDTFGFSDSVIVGQPTVLESDPVETGPTCLPVI